MRRSVRLDCRDGPSFCAVFVRPIPPHSGEPCGRPWTGMWGGLGGGPGRADRRISDGHPAVGADMNDRTGLKRARRRCRDRAVPRAERHGAMLAPQRWG